MSKKIETVLREAEKILQANNITEFRKEAKSLLAFSLNKNLAFLIAHNDYELNQIEYENFCKLIERRAKREPFQHITNNQEFYGLNFFVNKDVLIPRPETELIVENSLQVLQQNERFCEVGVGSGCISIAILHELKNVSSIGLDISEKALKIAQRNAETHQVLERFNLQKSDVFESLDNEKFALIVSNPPYISLEETKNLQAEVIDYEPLNALTDEKDGFTIIEKIIKESPKFLRENGHLFIEIGFGQAEKINKFVDSKIWQSFEILPDLQGIPRMVKLQLC
ncbi:MAG: peptide chain release factor N(5)-glutamine methyltransferase [Pyrinomonadaceae bacterium]|nr:peptide chain release factor N(5)-glutamine methyltransferase [Pyrinomonadaceae bacterium]